MRFGVLSYTLLGLGMRYRIQSLTQIGQKLTEIKAFEVVEISWDFKGLRFVVVSYTLLGLVMRYRIQNLTKIGWILAEIGPVKQGVS